MIDVPAWLSRWWGPLNALSRRTGSGLPHDIQSIVLRTCHAHFLLQYLLPVAAAEPQLLCTTKAVMCKEESYQRHCSVVQVVNFSFDDVVRPHNFFLFKIYSEGKINTMENAHRTFT